MSSEGYFAERGDAMNRQQRRRADRMEPAGPNRQPALPDFVKQQQANMAQIMVTAALTTLAEDFGFTPEQLNQFNEKFQARAMALSRPERR